MKKIFLLTSIIWYLISAPKVLGASEFTTTFSSVYTIEKSGDTTIQHTIILKNNLANIYATDYTLATSGDHMTHVQVADETGPLTATTSVQDGTTIIHLTIGHPTIGKDQKKTLTISYQTSDVVEMLGKTITINIPRLAKANEAETYTRIVKIANTSELTSLIYPPPNLTEPHDPYTVYTFVGHPSDSLTLLFGDSVSYQVNLTYLLKNKDLTSRESELALPPDTAYQHILLNKLDPPPEEITLDSDGNWLARYTLKSQEKLTVTAELFVTVFPIPSQYDPSTHNLVKNTRSQYWDTESPVVTDLAKKLKTPDNIYQYLVSNFTYNYVKTPPGINRLGVIAALSSPTLVLCTEFTDSFVSLARTLNIPSREINGYGYTTSPVLHPQSQTADILHAWPEYYDSAKSIWTSVDPTWGNTTGGIDYFHKLDFSHIAFVRHGVEDSYPLPAGAYKDSPSQKFVQVEIATDLPPTESSSVIENGILYNTGNISLIDSPVGYLPPHGHATLPTAKPVSLYAKIKLLCANLWSKFLRLLPAST